MSAGDTPTLGQSLSAAEDLATLRWGADHPHGGLLLPAHRLATRMWAIAFPVFVCRVHRPLRHIERRETARAEARGSEHRNGKCYSSAILASQAVLDAALRRETGLGFPNRRPGVSMRAVVDPAAAVSPRSPPATTVRPPFLGRTWVAPIAHGQCEAPAEPVPLKHRF